MDAFTSRDFTQYVFIIIVCQPGFDAENSEINLIFKFKYLENAKNTKMK